MTIHSCYSCGSDDVSWSDKYLGRDEEKFREMVLYWYSCNRCGLSTRWQTSLDEARFAWQRKNVDWSTIKDFRVIDQELV